MGFVKSLATGFLLFIVSSLLIADITDSEGGIYLLAINMMFVPLWGIIVLWSKYTKKIADREFNLVLGSFISSLVLLVILAGVYHQSTKVIGVFVVFMLLYFMFLLPLYVAKRKAEMKGEILTYSPADARYFWAYQWIVMGVFVIKSSDPFRVFQCLLPSLIGGYIIIEGLIKLKMNAMSNIGGTQK